MDSVRIAGCRGGGGQEQSPIDILSTEKAPLPAPRFDSKSGPLKYLVNNGHTIRVNYHDAPGTGSQLIVGEKRYQLTQFHFHRPSEEHVHGKSFDMVAHLMYQSADGTVVGVVINPGGLLPHNLAYYTYMGSVTAPPCTEGVRWYVLKTPVKVRLAPSGTHYQRLLTVNAISRPTGDALAGS